MLKLNEMLIDELFELNNKSVEGIKSVLNEDRRLVFILGAGVSVSLGFPSWVGLVAQTVARQICRFNISYLGKETSSTKGLHDIILNSEVNMEKILYGIDKGYTDAFKGNDMLEIAEYVLNSVRESIQDGNDLLRDDIANYSIKELVGDCMRMTETEFDKCLKKKYKKSTIKAIIDVINKGYEKFQYQEVITYNYDDAIELCLEKKAKISRNNIKSISYTDYNTSFESGKINIAHVHGKIGLVDKENASDNIILSESSYYDMERSEYLWQHTVQAKAMLDNPCLFVGFSAQDYNFRRIIKNSKNIHDTYIIFTIDDIIRNICRDAMKKMAMLKIRNKSRRTEKKDIVIDYLDIDDVIKKHENEFLNKIFKSHIKSGKANTAYNDYAYERLFLSYIIKAQTDYWKRNNIIPIWTTIEETPGLIRNIGNV